MERATSEMQNKQLPAGLWRRRSDKTMFRHPPKSSRFLSVKGCLSCLLILSSFPCYSLSQLLQYWTLKSFVCLFLLPLDSGLISIQQLCGHKAVSHWFGFFISQTHRRKRRGAKWWKNKGKWDNAKNRKRWCWEEREWQARADRSCCGAQSTYFSGSARAYRSAALWHSCSLLPTCST